MFEFPSILPPNRTPFEEALEQALHKGKPDLAPIANLMDPDTCPAEALGWLAWSFSVDVWSPDWTETQKRNAIRSAIQVHRVKGTRGAVRRALGAIGFNFQIVEWFEDGSAPRTFRIDAYSKDIFDAGLAVSSELVDMVSELVDNVKPVAAHFKLRVGEEKLAPMRINTGSLIQRHDARDVVPTLPTDLHAPSLAARTGHHQRLVSQQTHSFTMENAA